MNSRESHLVAWHSRASGAAIVALVASILLAGSLAAEEHKSNAAPSSVALAPSDGPKEGIKVHGHWTIEIHQPDGTLVSRHEFENALLSQGGLASVLARQFTVGIWTVRLLGSPFACGRDHCAITENSSTLPESPALFKTLTVLAPTSGGNAGKLVLSGSVTAANNSSIGRVTTTYFRCPPTTTPASNCQERESMTGFTAATLSPEVSVSAGQQVLVTVVISFS